MKNRLTIAVAGLIFFSFIIGIFVIFEVIRTHELHDVKKVISFGKYKLPKPLLFPSNVEITSVAISPEKEDIGICYSIKSVLPVDKMHQFYQNAYPESTWLSFEQNQNDLEYTGKVKDGSGNQLYTLIIYKPHSEQINPLSIHQDMQIAFHIPQKQAEQNGALIIPLPK